MNALEYFRTLELGDPKNHGLHVQIEFNGLKREYKAFNGEYSIHFVSWEPFEVFDHFTQIPGVMEGAGICVLD